MINGELNEELNAGQRLVQRMSDAHKKLSELRRDTRKQEAETDWLDHTLDSYLALREKVGHSEATARLEQMEIS
jgi:hypothetical protein